jgi:formylmethanofuran dehydrogenase subunit E
MPNCTRCGSEIESWDGNYFSRGMLCSTCYTESGRRQDEKTAICTRCGLRILPKEANLKLGRTLCGACYDEVVKEQRERYCASCHKLIEGASFERPDGSYLCLKCMQGQSPFGGGRQAIRTCDKCGRMSVVHYVTSEGLSLCPKCAPSAHTGKGLLRSLMDGITKLRRQ